MKNLLLKKNIREFFQNKSSYFFLLMIIAIGFAAQVSLYTFMNTRQKVYDKIYEKSNFMDLDVQLLYGAGFSENQAESFFQHDEYKIENIEKTLNFDVIIQKNKEDNTEELVRGKVIGYDVNSSKKFSDIKVNTPLFYQDTYKDISTTDNEVYLEKNFAVFYDILPGDTLTIYRQGKTYELKVADYINVPKYFSITEENDIFTSQSTLGIIVMPIKSANEIYTENKNSDVVFNEFYLDIEQGYENETKNKIASVMEEQGIQTQLTLGIDNAARKVIKDDIDQDKEIFMIFPYIFFCAAALGLFVVMRRTIDSKKTEIGLYKALGVKSGVLYKFYNFTAIILSILSIFIGFVLSIGLIQYFSNMMKFAYNFAVTDIFIDYKAIGVGVILVFLINFISVLLPVRSAIKMPTIDALQKREGIDKANNGGLSRFISKNTYLPSSIKLSLKYLLRNPFRSLTTSLGIILSITLFFGVYLMMNSFLVMLDKVKKSDTWSYQLQLATFAPESELDKVNFPEIEKYYSLTLPVEFISTDGKNYPALAYGMDLNNFQSIFNINLQKNLSDENGIVLSKYLAEKLDVNIGDEVRLNLPELTGDQKYIFSEKIVKVVNIHDGVVGSIVYINDDTFQNLTGLDSLYNFVYLKDTKNSYDADIKKIITQSDVVTSVITSQQKKDQYDTIFESFSQVVYLVLFISFILALSIVYNMYVLNVNDRIRDYSTMRTLGTSMKRVARLLAVESIIVYLIGLVIGTGTSILFAKGIVARMRSSFEDLTFNVSFSWEGYLLTILLIGVTMILVYFTVIRRISNLDLASMLKYRAN